MFISINDYQDELVRVALVFIFPDIKSNLGYQPIRFKIREYSSINR